MQRLDDAVATLRQAALRGHPEARRFRRFLRTLTLTPSAAVAPGDLEPDDFIICGAPRTGTTLLTAMLHQPPRVVTVTEPWDGLRMPPRDLMASLRDEIESTGRLRRGILDIVAAERGDVVRVAEGDGAAPVHVRPGWMLGVKWPTFVQLVRQLKDTRFLICARHPYDAIASFKAIGGSVSRGQEYAAPFNDELNERVMRAARWSPAERRIELFAQVHEMLVPSLADPNCFVVRYEAWFEPDGGQWGGLADFLGVDLRPTQLELRKESKRRLLTERERRLIRSRCADIATALGYELD